MDNEEDREFMRQCKELAEKHPEPSGQAQVAAGSGFLLATGGVTG